MVERLDYEAPGEPRGLWARTSEGMDWMIVLAVSAGLVVGAAGLGAFLYRVLGP